MPIEPLPLHIGDVIHFRVDGLHEPVPGCYRVEQTGPDWVVLRPLRGDRIPVLVSGADAHARVIAARERGHTYRCVGTYGCKRTDRHEGRVGLVVLPTVPDGRYLTIRMPAGDGELFSPDSAANLIGTTHRLTHDPTTNLTAMSGTGRVTAARVVDDGAAILITIDTRPEETTQ